MIGWLNGAVRLRDPKASAVIIETGGVGYRVLTSLQTMAAIPEVGARCELWIHTHVREDALELFGFVTRDERQMFLLLLSVPQVGPRLALTVLGGFPLPELAAAISRHELGTLQKIPGVGKKTAERILIDLREKVAALELTGHAHRDGQSEPDVADGPEQLQDDAQIVLINLGFKRKPVEAAIRQEMAERAEPFTSLDDLVRAALARLMRT